TILVLAALAVAACGNDNSALAGNANGSAGDMPAYYDHHLLTINFKELPDDAAADVLANNPSINVSFMSEDPLPDGSEFVAVLDAIQGDGFNPLWVEAEIEFTAGHTPRQLFSDDEIADAVQSGEITLKFTDEVYRCSVVGPGPKREKE